MNERVKLVGVAYVSNDVGYGMNPVKEMIDAAHAIGAYALLDGAQAIQHFPVDGRYWIVIFSLFQGICIWAHGVSILYGKRNLLSKCHPGRAGRMIKEVRFEKTTYNELPFKFEAGPGFYRRGRLGEAFGVRESIGLLVEIAEYEHGLMDYAMKQI